MSDSAKPSVEPKTEQNVEQEPEKEEEPDNKEIEEKFIFLEEDFEEEEEFFEGEMKDDEIEDKDWKPIIPDIKEERPPLPEDSSLMTLDKLPTWANEGPEIVKNNPLPKFTTDIEANTEINEKVSFWMRGNSAKLVTDAVVNAANSHLYPGGGICGVLHSAAGPEMEEECDKIGYTKTGRCAVTLGYKLPAKYCIHTVGPVGEYPEKLKMAYESTLACIDGEKIRSIGFCCISTGIYGYPIIPATEIALETVRNFLEVPENREKTDRIVFVVFERRDVAVYNKLRHLYFPLDIDYSQFVEEEEEEEQPKEEQKEEQPKEEQKEEQPKEECKEEQKEECKEEQKEE